MGAFYYYFPQRQTVNKGLMRQAGLGHLIEDGVSPNFKGASVGPDGGGGAIAVLRVDKRADWAGLNDDTVWQNCGAYWLGHDPERAPGPDDLLRALPLDESTPVELGDGNLWEIPVARRANGRTALPRVARWDADKGYYFGDVVEQYQAFFRGAMAAFDAMIAEAKTGATGDQWSIGIELDLWTAALNANYRVGPAEVGTLGLITSTNRRAIFDAVVDMAGMQEIVKKKGIALAQSGPPSSSPGVEGSSPTTSQPSASCT